MLAHYQDHRLLEAKLCAIKLARKEEPLRKVILADAWAGREYLLRNQLQ